jgi:hypothetical protein
MNYLRIGNKWFRINNHRRLNHFDRRRVMIRDVVSARHIRDYELELEFEDGAKGVVDFSQYRDRGGVFCKFNDMEYFKNFRIDKERGVISWENGVDIAPETLYSKAVGKAIVV